VYLKLYSFGKETQRPKILHRMTASILRLQSALNFFQRNYYQSSYCAASGITIYKV